MHGAYLCISFLLANFSTPDTHAVCISGKSQVERERERERERQRKKEREKERNLYYTNRDEEPDSSKAGSVKQSQKKR